MRQLLKIGAMNEPSLLVEWKRTEQERASREAGALADGETAGDDEENGEKTPTTGRNSPLSPTLLVHQLNSVVNAAKPQVNVRCTNCLYYC